MNRWTFLSVLVIVAGTVAAFAVWTYGEDGDTGTGSDAALARAYAGIIAHDVGDARVESVTRVSGDVWKMKAASGGVVKCLLIDLSRFRRNGKNDYEGIVPAVPCEVLGTP